MIQRLPSGVNLHHGYPFANKKRRPDRPIPSAQQPRFIFPLAFTHPFFFDKIQGRRIDTVAKTRRLRTIVKNVSKVTIAPAARDFSPRHAETPVRDLLDAPIRNGFPKARPARPGVKLCRRAEQVVSTTDTPIFAFSFEVVVFTRKGRFGSVLPGDVVLFRT